MKIKELATDFYRYMDTTVPRGVETGKYTKLKYMNRESIHSFVEAHPDVSPQLLDHLARYELMKQDEKTILEKIKIFMEKEVDENVNNRRTNQ